MLVTHQTLMALKRPVHMRVGSSCQELVDAASVVDCAARTAGGWRTCLGAIGIDQYCFTEIIRACSISLRKLRPSPHNRRGAVLWTLRMNRGFQRHSPTWRRQRDGNSPPKLAAS